MKSKILKLTIFLGMIAIFFSGCSRQQIGYSILQKFGVESEYSYLQEIEDGAELTLNDSIVAVVEYNSHPQNGNDINFYSAHLTNDDDINNTVNQITNNRHWKKTPLENTISDVLYETDVLKEANFPEIKNGYYLFYWEYDSPTADEIKKIYGITEENKNKINTETCKYLGYFDTDTNTIYFMTFFKNSLSQ